jgi:ATP-dependent Lhr-like helicase
MHPFGSRINKAWALALRKRFCRQFNFELQGGGNRGRAAPVARGTTLVSAFRCIPLPASRDCARHPRAGVLDAPVFQTRWRWNATISLAVPRNRSGRKVPPQLQRMLADDLMAAAFPRRRACQDNIPGDRQIPDHPLVSQSIRDCLEEAMDIDGLCECSSRIHRGELRSFRATRPSRRPSPTTS